MVQRKLIVVFGVVALLAVTAGVGQASLSRLEGMGLSDAALRQFTDDYANIYYFPTSVVRQNNLVLAEVGNNPSGLVDPVQFLDQSLTLIKSFPNFGSIAYQMKQTALNSNFPSNLTHEQIDLIWGKGLANLDVAVRLDMTNSSYEQDDNSPAHFEMRGSGAFIGTPYPFGAVAPDLIAATGTELNTWGVTPALAFHLKDDDRIETAITFRDYSLDRSASVGGVAGPEWKTEGGMSYTIAARAFLHSGDRATWIPAVWYVNDDLSYEVNNVFAGPRAVDESYKSLGLGISHNMRVNDNNLLIFGARVSQFKSSFERTDNNTGGLAGETRTQEFTGMLAPEFFASLETDATNWLKIRLGATKARITTKDEFTDFAATPFSNTIKETTSEFQFALGTGIRFNNLDIDMTLNESFPLSGGWILSGDPATPFTRVSGTYHF